MKILSKMKVHAPTSFPEEEETPIGSKTSGTLLVVTVAVLASARKMCLKPLTFSSKSIALNIKCKYGVELNELILKAQSASLQALSLSGSTCYGPNLWRPTENGSELFGFLSQYDTEQYTITSEHQGVDLHCQKYRWGHWNDSSKVDSIKKKWGIDWDGIHWFISDWLILFDWPI